MRHCLSAHTLNGYLGLSETLGTGRLSATQREIVALAAGQANRCQYCLSAHTLIGKGAGLSAEAIAAARTGQAANALDDAIAGFARALVEQRGVVSADAMANYRRAGLDDGLILRSEANLIASNAAPWGSRALRSPPAPAPGPRSGCGGRRAPPARRR